MPSEEPELQNISIDTFSTSSPIDASKTARVLKLRLVITELCFQLSILTSIIGDGYKKIVTKEFPNPCQFVSRCFYLLLDEECRAYLIDLRRDWFGSRSKNWYTNLEVSTKSVIFLVNLYWGLIWSRVKRLNPMSRRPKF